jgi:hypothetical protein
VLSQNCERWLLALSRPSASLSVRPSIHPSAWNNSDPTKRVFMRFDMWAFFRKSAEKVQVSLKPDKNNGYVTWRHYDIMTASRWTLLGMRNVSDKRCTESQNRYFIFNTFFRKSYRLWVIWKNIVQPDGTRTKVLTLDRTDAVCMPEN